MSETFVVDLTNYRDRMGERIAPGRYRVRVDDAEMDTSRNGNRMVNLWLTVVGGEFDGATIVDRLTITENAMFRVVGFMQAIGIPTPKKRIQINLRQFMGQVLEVDVEDGEPYNGRVKSEVRGYMKTEKAPVADLEDTLTPAAEAAEAVIPTASTESDPWESDDDDSAVDLSQIEL